MVDFKALRFDAMHATEFSWIIYLKQPTYKELEGQRNIVQL